MNDITATKELPFLVFQKTKSKPNKTKTIVNNNKPLG
jgi:hypothetical protein